MRVFRVLLLITLLGLSGGLLSVKGQSLKGVYWVPPSNTREALEDLLKMKEAGVEALRTPLIEDAKILFWIDSLRIWLYQDLPLAGLTVVELRDTLDYARGLLREVLERSRPYPYARFFGLLSGSDVASENMRPYLDTLTHLVHAVGPPGSSTYYVSFFRKGDRAHTGVNQVLLDLLDVPAPAEEWGRRDTLAGTPTGIGALGTFVAPDLSVDGFRVVHSPSHQAYYMEQALEHLNDIPLFIYRWRDAVPGTGAYGCPPDAFLPRWYGLHDAEGNPRLVWEVVSGLFTGRVRAFLFPEGIEVHRTTEDWIRFFGLLFLLGFPLLWAGFPMVRRTTVRFLGARFFYLEALRRNEVPGMGVLTLLLGVWAIQHGMILRVFWGIFQTSEASVRLLCVWDGQMQALWQLFLLHPWLTVPLGVGIFLVGFFVLTAIAYLLVGKIWKIPALFTLILWHWWAIQFVLLGALLLTTFPVEVQLHLLGPGALLWFLVSLWIPVRVGMDVHAQRGRGWVIPLLAFLAGGLVLTVTYVLYAPKWQFAFHVVRWLTHPSL